jgi:hypothetical protein
VIGVNGRRVMEPWVVAARSLARRQRCARERAERPPVDVVVDGESLSSREESISRYDTFDDGLQSTASARQEKRQRAVDFVDTT